MHISMTTYKNLQTLLWISRPDILYFEFLSVWQVCLSVEQGWILNSVAPLTCVKMLNKKTMLWIWNPEEK